MCECTYTARTDTSLWMKSEKRVSGYSQREQDIANLKRISVCVCNNGGEADRQCKLTDCPHRVCSFNNVRYTDNGRARVASGACCVRCLPQHRRRNTGTQLAVLNHVSSDGAINIHTTIRSEVPAAVALNIRLHIVDANICEAPDSHLSHGAANMPVAAL